MKINSETYYEILVSISSTSFETGGILGGTNKIVSEFIFDEGLSNSNRGRYYPNIDKLNNYFATQQKCRIEFYGVMYRHLTNDDFIICYQIN